MPVKQATTKTTFTKVGDSVAKVATATSRGVQRGKLVKKGNSKGGMLEGATQAHKANILERNGASFAPKAVLYAANAPEAAQTLRNTRIVPSAVGNRDFYLRRQYGQGM